MDVASSNHVRIFRSQGRSARYEAMDRQPAEAQVDRDEVPEQGHNDVASRGIVPDFVDPDGCAQSTVSSITGVLPLDSIYPAFHHVEETLSNGVADSAAPNLPTPSYGQTSPIQPTSSLQALEHRMLDKATKHKDDESVAMTEGLGHPKEAVFRDDSVLAAADFKESASRAKAVRKELQASLEEATARVSIRAEPGAYAEAGTVPNQSELIHQRIAMGGMEESTIENLNNDNSPEIQGCNSMSSTQLGLAKASLVLDTSTKEDLQVAERVEEDAPCSKAKATTHKQRSKIGLLPVIAILVLLSVVILVSVTITSISDADKGEQLTLEERRAMRWGEIKREIALELGNGTHEQLALPNSPYFKAMDWIVHEDPMQLVPSSENLLQRYILALVYFKTSEVNNGQWRSCSAGGKQGNLTYTTDICYFHQRWRLHFGAFYEVQEAFAYRWLSGRHECYWAGLLCKNMTSNKKVTEMSLYDFNLTGTVPTELAKLEDLQVLSLSSNRLSGSPPSELGLLRNLRVINLESNQLSGLPIPEEWFRLANLTHLNLGDHRLGGNQYSPSPLSSHVGQLRKLEDLSLSLADTTGTLPSELFHLTKLRSLSFWMNNRLTGTLPSELGLLSKMEFSQLGTCDNT